MNQIKFMKKIQSLIIITFLFLTASCQANTKQMEQNLSKTVEPKQLVLENKNVAVNLPVPMAKPTSVTIKPTLIKVNDAKIRLGYGKKSAETQNQEITSETELSAAEVQNLYKVFLENKFDSLKPNKDMGVADGKSRSIELKFDQNRFYATNGDGIEPPKGHVERFSKIEDAIGKLIAAHSKKEN